MLVAFTTLIPPSIYDLDIDLANSCWFITTSLLAVVLTSPSCRACSLLFIYCRCRTVVDNR